jgi:hypothetical protein
MYLPRLAAALLAAAVLPAVHAADCAALHDYADATIAFLEGDKAALQASRARLAQALAKSEFNGPNLKAVDRLERCFGQPYKIAYDCASAGVSATSSP